MKQRATYDESLYGIGGDLRLRTVNRRRGFLTGGKPKY